MLGKGGKNVRETYTGIKNWNIIQFKLKYRTFLNDLMKSVDENYSNSTMHHRIE